MRPLEAFYAGLLERVHRDGWVEIILPLVTPVINELIARCFDSGPALMRTNGRLSALQRMGLNNAARQIVLDAGIPLGRRRQAIIALAAAIEAEFSEQLKSVDADSVNAAYSDACMYV